MPLLCGECTKMITSKHNLSLILWLSLFYSYCNRENQHSPALSPSTVGQKGDLVQGFFFVFVFFFGNIILDFRFMSLVAGLVSNKETVWFLLTAVSSFVSLRMQQRNENRNKVRATAQHPRGRLRGQIAKRWMRTHKTVWCLNMCACIYRV